MKAEAKKSKNRYKITSLIVSLIICLTVIYLHLLSHQKTQKIYLAQTEKTIIALKKDFLKDTVNNVFLEIDRLRETKYRNYKRNTESRLRRLQDELKLTDDAFITFFKETFKDETSSKMWTAFMWNDETRQVLYTTPNVQFETIEVTSKKLKSDLSSYGEIKKNNIKAIFGVSKAYIDDLVKEEIAEVIQSRKFSSDSYIWVNEVRNYEGGKDYAIRKIHPNLIQTDGDLLSTDMTDEAGNFPYLEELQGINEHGELFFNYYFKKPNSSEISEKITYAKLYKDFNWIIAMGLHLDDIDEFTDKINNEIYSLSSESTIRLLRYILVVLLMGFTILYWIDKNRFSRSTQSLEKEINLDTLTKAYSRRYGQKSLSSYFKNYKATGENAAVMMFDLDGFKYINDHFGHKIGDLVLIEVVRTINTIIRSSDHLIRWGGDEFVGVFPGLKEENILGSGEKILNEISAIEIPVDDDIIKITVSIGFSYFKDGDIDYNDVLKRADDAMYQSKKQGKNKVTID